MTRRDNLTVVMIAYRKNRLNHRLIFGEPVLRIRRGWRRELAVFRSGQIFAYERWRANKYGTQDWRLFVCEASGGGSITRIPGVQPGANLLLAARGRRRVKRALARIDALIRAQPCLSDVTPRDWRELHNDIETGAKFEGDG